MVKFAQKFILLSFLITFLPLLCLFNFHKMNIETERQAQENEMLNRISQQFTVSINAFLENEEQKLENEKDLRKLKNSPDVVSLSKTPFSNIPHLKIYKGEELVGAYYIENKGDYYEVLKKINLNNFFFLAPIAVEVYDRNNSEKPVVEINKPPLPIFTENKYKDIYQDGLKIRIIAITPLGQNLNNPPIVPQIAIMLSSFVLCTLLVSYINKIFIKPLNEVIINLEKIKKGNLNVKFETQSGNEEIKHTYETLNKMVSGLIEKEKLRNNFIQDLIRDLGSPMVTQNRALAVLQEEFHNHELINGIKNDNRDYLKMINLILQCYKCDDKAILIDKIELNLSNLLNSIIKALEPLSKEKNVKIINKIKPENLIIFGDYISINRILMNLISSAIECMGNRQIKKRGKKIEILAQNFERYSTIIIQDNGCGIKKEELDKIFDKYGSYNNSVKKAVYEQGLCIVQNLIQKNSGEIIAESKANSYTKFTIKLPNKGYETIQRLGNLAFEEVKQN